MYTEASRTRKCLIMLACLYLQCVSIGIIFALAVLYPEIIKVFGCSRSEASLIQSIYGCVLMSGGIILSPIIRRFGPGTGVIIGTIFGALGLALTIMANSILIIVMTAGFIGSMGMSLCYLSSFICVSWTFHRDPGVALVFVTIGSSIGQFTLPYLTEVLIEAFSWNGAFLLLSGVALQCIPCGCLMYTSRHYYKTDTKAEDLSLTENVKKICDTSLITDIAVLLILLNSFLMAITGNIESFYFVDILTSRGFTRERGSFLLTMLGFSNMIGRVIGTTLRFKVKIKTIYHWIYLWPIIAVSHLLAVTLRDYGGIMGACLLYGVTFGTCTAQNQAIMFDVCGLSRASQGVAMLNLMYGIGSFFKSFLGGVVKDVVGVYDPMFYLAAGSGIYISISSAVVVIIQRRREKAEMEEKWNVSKFQYKKLQYGTQNGHS